MNMRCARTLALFSLYYFAIGAMVGCRQEDTTDPGSRGAVSSGSDKSRGFDPQDLQATTRWLATVTEPYIQALKERNAFTISEAKAEVSRRVKEVPSATRLQWKTKVLAVKPDEVWVFEDERIKSVLLDLNIRPDDTSSGEYILPNRIPIGKCIDLKHARSLKSGDVLVLNGTLRELTVYYFSDDYVSYHAVITNATAEPSK